MGSGRIQRITEYDRRCSAGHTGTPAEVRHIAPGKALPLLFCMLTLLLCPIKWEEWACCLSSCAGRNLKKEFMWSCSWTVTSRSDSGGLLLLSRCFPRALTDSVCVVELEGVFLYIQKLVGHILTHSTTGQTPAPSWAVCAWWEGSLDAMNCSVTTATFCSVPKAVARVPAWCHWTSFAVGVFGAEIWQCCTAGTWMLWLFCRPSESQWELLPKPRVFHDWVLVVAAHTAGMREGAHAQALAWAEGGDLSWMNGLSS